MIYSCKGHEDRNRYKNRIKRSGRACLVYVADINRNIPTTRKWARGDCTEGEVQRYCGPVPMIILKQSVEISHRISALIGSQCSDRRMGWTW